MQLKINSIQLRISKTRLRISPDTKPRSLMLDLPSRRVLHGMKTMLVTPSGILGGRTMPQCRDRASDPHAVTVRGLMPELCPLEWSFNVPWSCHSGPAEGWLVVGVRLQDPTRQRGAGKPTGFGCAGGETCLSRCFPLENTGMGSGERSKSHLGCDGALQLSLGSQEPELGSAGSCWSAGFSGSVQSWDGTGRDSY